MSGRKKKKLNAPFSFGKIAAPPSRKSRGDKPEEVIYPPSAQN